MAAVPSVGRATRVEGAAAPEADATRTLYERYGPQIFGYCLHQLGSREEAEDAVQSTFLNAFRGLRRGVVPDAEQAWLFKIAQNVCLSRRRSTWRRGRIESPADFDVAEEQAAAPHRRADELIGLQDVLENMPENQRRAILLREWQGLSYREIAEELELSQAAVETLIFRARRALASGLEASPSEQRSWRARVRSSLDAGSLAAWLKSFLVSGVAVKAAGTAAVVTVASAVVAIPQEHTNPRTTPKPAPKTTHAAAPASTATRQSAWTPPPVALAPSAVEATAPVARPHSATTPTQAREHHARSVRVGAPSPASAPAAAAPSGPAPEQPPVAPTPAAPAAVVDAPRSQTTHAGDRGNAGGRNDHARRADGAARPHAQRDLAGPAATEKASGGATAGHDGSGDAQPSSAQPQHGRRRDDRPQAQSGQATGHGKQQAGTPAGADGHGQGGHDQGGRTQSRDQATQVAGNAAGGGHANGHDNVVGQQAPPSAPNDPTAPTPDSTAAPADETHVAGNAGDGGGHGR